MIKKTDYTDNECILQPRRYAVARHNNGGAFFCEDVVYTQLGLVFARRYANRTTEHTIMTFVWRGIEYTRQWEKVWTDKTVTQLAREMMEEVVRSTVDN